ncbi:isoleucyl-tRNA synthetase [Venturia nashicola]|nr:isoleucyl-tRNA synthetase [Venturia nashicola]
MLKPTTSLLTSWSKTLHLPKSAFPPRAPLPSPYLKRCTDDLYAWQQANRPKQNTFVLHDGPPYANGSLHIGHALNKILKDIICRYQLSQGKRVNYIPGWDCHGLPIEIKALQALKVHHDDVGAVDIRKAARELAMSTVEEQKAGFKEWGVMGDWDHAYKTMEKGFEMRQLKVFKEMVEKGLVERRRKPVYWSPSSGTALAEAELEYDEAHKSLAAFIRYPIHMASERLRAKGVVGGDDNIGLLIWTTTPWTLPANEAIAVNEDLEYVVVEMQQLQIPQLSDMLPDHKVPDHNSNKRAGPHLNGAENFVGRKTKVLVARSRLEYLQSIFGEDKVTILSGSITGKAEDGGDSTLSGTIFGSDIVGTTYRNTMQCDRVVDGAEGKGREYLSPVIAADFVSSAAGSGLVHLAPGHGMDDYNVCSKLGLPISAPVDDQGRFTSDVGYRLLRNLPVLKEGTRAVLDRLYTQGTPDSWRNPDCVYLLAAHEITHKYPIDWRTKEPIIIRATEQWFADVADLQTRALEAMASVKFIPDTGRSRLESFVKGRSQWCISRQRAWGVPIPALYRVDSGDHEAVMNGSTINHIMNVIEERGIDAWWTDAQDEPAWVPQGLEGNYVRGKDTMDVWFDSGTSWTLLEDRGPSQSVADVYLEGSDQHRGWFQSSLLTNVATQERDTSAHAPFKTLITHGFTLDQSGRKMSKSLGNVISPSQITDGSLLPPVKRKKQKGQPKTMEPSFDALGADALRLWVASSDYTSDIVIGTPVLQSVHQSLHKFRVTFKWLLGALSKQDPKQDLTSLRENSPYRFIDSLAIQQLSATAASVHVHYSAYEFHKGVAVLNKYVNSDLSAFYFETLKDRLYTGSAVERITAERVLFHIFEEMLGMLGPITPLLVQEVWEFTPENIKSGMEDPLRKIWTPLIAPEGLEMSKELATGTVYGSHSSPAEILSKTLHYVKSAQEMIREKGGMGSSLECDLHVQPCHDASRKALRFMLDIQPSLANYFVVSKVHLYFDTDFDGVEENFHALKKEGAEEATVPLVSTEGESADYRVLVSRPSGSKCDRCWRYLALRENGLCVRCDDVVKEEFPQLLEEVKTA